MYFELTPQLPDYVKRLAIAAGGKPLRAMDYVNLTVGEGVLALSVQDSHATKTVRLPLAGTHHAGSVQVHWGALRDVLETAAANATFTLTPQGKDAYLVMQEVRAKTRFKALEGYEWGLLPAAPAMLEASYGRMALAPVLAALTKVAAAKNEWGDVRLSVDGAVLTVWAWDGGGMVALADVPLASPVDTYNATFVNATALKGALQFALLDSDSADMVLGRDGLVLYTPNADVLVRGDTGVTRNLSFTILASGQVHSTDLYKAFKSGDCTLTVNAHGVSVTHGALTLPVPLPMNAHDNDFFCLMPAWETRGTTSNLKAGLTKHLGMITVSLGQLQEGRLVLVLQMPNGVTFAHLITALPPPAFERMVKAAAQHHEARLAALHFYKASRLYAAMPLEAEAVVEQALYSPWFTWHGWGLDAAAIETAKFYTDAYRQVIKLARDRCLDVWDFLALYR